MHISIFCTPGSQVYSSKALGGSLAGTSFTLHLGLQPGKLEVRKYTHLHQVLNNVQMIAPCNVHKYLAPGIKLRRSKWSRRSSCELPAKSNSVKFNGQLLAHLVPLLEPSDLLCRLRQPGLPPESVYRKIVGIPTISRNRYFYQVVVVRTIYTGWFF